MSPLSSTPALSVPAAYPRVDASQASGSATADRAAAKATAAANAQAVERAIGVPAAAASAMNGLSTIAVAGAMSSIPAALGRMGDIVLATSSGTLSDADRATLQAEYAQLDKQVASVVGSVSAGQQGASTSDKGDEKNHDDSHDAGPRSGSDGSSATGYQTPDRAVRAKTASATSTVAAASRADTAHEPARGAAPRVNPLRAASVAQFQQPAMPVRGRISVVA